MIYSRLVPLLATVVLLSGCFGKLLFGDTRTDGGACIAIDDGGWQRAAAGVAYAACGAGRVYGHGE